MFSTFKLIDNVLNQLRFANLAYQILTMVQLNFTVLSKPTIEKLRWLLIMATFSILLLQDTFTESHLEFIEIKSNQALGTFFLS